MLVNSVEITHPDKILFPKLKVTKYELAAYYSKIAKYILPYISNRPLTLRQYPKGIKGPNFYHKHASELFPASIPRYKVPMHSSNEIMLMLGIEKISDLINMVEFNTIEFHTNLSLAKKLEYPDQIILDFDPSDRDFEKVRQVALITKDILDKEKCNTFVKTTGSRGLHIHIPLKPKKKFVEVKKAARDLAKYIQQQCPNLSTIEQRKNKRNSKVFIDYLRNDYNMTAIVPYSVRANEVAGIATPLHWHEVENKNIHSQSFTIKNIFHRIAHFDNPWKNFR